MAGLVRGDPVPNFKRYDQHGALRKLHDDLHCGQPIVLLVAHRSVLRQLHQALVTLPHSAALNGTATVIGLTRAASNQRLDVREVGAIDAPLLVDDGSLSDYLVGPERRDDALTALALDSNLRVLARLEVGDRQDVEALDQKLGQLYRQAPAIKPQVLTGPAPVLMIPRVFEPTFCDELIGKFRRHGGTPSGVMYTEGDKTQWMPEPSIKIRKDYVIEEQQCQERIRALLARRVLPEIQKCFNYTVVQHEPFKLICYQARTGGYFRAHRDNATQDAAHRRFAMTINLNTGDYRGGELRFPEFGPHLYAPQRGAAIVFSCSLVHEACDVTAGERYAMLGFFFGDE